MNIYEKKQQQKEINLCVAKHIEKQIAYGSRK